MPQRAPTSPTTKLGWAAYPAFGIAATAYATLAFTRADADLWGHVRFGLDILRDWSLPSVDPYSFTQDRPWLNHEWLSELQMGAAYAALGTTGLVVLKATLAFAVFWLVWQSLATVRLAGRVSVMVLVGLGTIHMTSSLRPQLWTFLAVTIVCRTLIDGRPRALTWLPLVFGVWANLHGGWILGLAIVALWAAAEGVARPTLAARWAALVIACALATLVTPHSWRLWQFLWQTVGLERPDITEWGPLWGTPALNWVPWFAGLAGTMASLAVRAGRRWSTGLVLMMLAYGSARVMRVESLFVVAAAILLAPALAAAWPARPIDLTRHASRYDPLVALALVALLGAGAVVLAGRAIGCVPPIGGWAPDATAVEMLARAAPGRLVTTFNWGEYALWHLGPRITVSIDGRRETVYSDRRLTDNASVVSGEPAGFARLAEWRAEYVWLPASSAATRTWLVANGYRIDFESAGSFVAVRSDRAPLLSLPAPRENRTRCFPD